MENHPQHSFDRLKASFELHSFSMRGSAREVNEVRDTANNNEVVFSGTYRQCVAYCRKIGVWYS
jgi:hypothetical protein